MVTLPLFRSHSDISRLNDSREVRCLTATIETNNESVGLGFDPWLFTCRHDNATAGLDYSRPSVAPRAVFEGFVSHGVLLPTLLPSRSWRSARGHYSLRCT